MSHSISSRLRTVMSLTALSVLASLGYCQDMNAAGQSASGSNVANYRKVSLTKFDILPPKALAKSKPIKPTIYEWDSTPLGDRSAFLLVHGLRGEYYPTFRWQKVAKRLESDPEFARLFKLYLVRYDSKAPFSKTVPKFRNAVAQLSDATNGRPIRIMALSMGGNLSYEAMQDAATDARISLLLTLGTPFHGSPLFTANWLQYGIYRNVYTPWARIDQAKAYRMYFAHNPNLLEDLRWDNADNAIPNAGPFKSHLPFGPSGVLTVADSANQRISDLNAHAVDKKKIVAYSGYLTNPFLRPETERVIETTCLYPVTLVTVKLPAHLAREHAVLKLLNHMIAGIVPTQEAANKANWSYIYDMNDGITPVSSALFLPNDVCGYIARETDIAKIKNSVDLGQGRIFKNTDHLSFIDGYRPSKISNANLKDELNPEDGSRQIFDWMLLDIARSVDKNKTIAHGPEDEPVARQ